VNKFEDPVLNNKQKFVYKKILPAKGLALQTKSKIAKKNHKTQKHHRQIMFWHSLAASSSFQFMCFFL